MWLARGKEKPRGNKWSGAYLMFVTSTCYYQSSHLNADVQLPYMGGGLPDPLAQSLGLPQ